MTSFDLESHSGTRHIITDPQPDDILIEDIAHGLSMQCRYNGAVERFYSVAEHSVIVVNTLAATYPDHPRLKQLLMIGLLHDAAEAYLGDIVRGLKYKLPYYLDLENKWLRVIFESFGILTSDIDLFWEMVKDADDEVLATEASTLLKSKGVGWNVMKNHSPHKAIKHDFKCYVPTEAKQAFMDKWVALS